MLREVVARLIERAWPKDRTGSMQEPTGAHSEILCDKIQELVPTNDAQRTLQNRARGCPSFS